MSTSRPPPRLVAVRYVAFGILAFLATFFAWFVASLLVLVQPRRCGLASRVQRLWGRAAVASSGAHLVVENQERLSADEVRMIVANHASFLDPPTMLAVVPGNVRFVMKKELARVPLIGWYSSLAGHFLLDRGRPREGHDILQRALDRARRYTLLPVIFAEGTRSTDGRLQPLKPGSFQLAVQGGIPVQPIAICGTAEIMPKKAWGPRCKGRVVVRVGNPIPTEGLEGSTGRKILAARVRAALLELGVPDGAGDSPGATGRNTTP